MGEDQEIAIATIIIFILLGIYIISGSVMEAKHSPLGHETGVTLIIGFLVSLILYLTTRGQNIQPLFNFNEGVFFYLCLPPIVFASGYNMRRKRFFENIGYILLFGLLGTIIIFVIFSSLSIGFMSIILMWKYDIEKENWVPFSLDVMEILLVSSLLCSSDVLAAISMIKYEEQPRLFSLIFGEGITNDAVAIILFNTVEEFIGEN